MKIRFKTWYWGKYILSGSYLDDIYTTLDTPGFELYIEEIHGLHNETNNNKQGVIKMTREYTNKLLELIKEGLLDKDKVIMACVKCMSEDDVKDMMEHNGFVTEEDEEKGE